MKRASKRLSTPVMKILFWLLILVGATIIFFGLLSRLPGEIPATFQIPTSENPSNVILVNSETTTAIATKISLTSTPSSSVPSLIETIEVPANRASGINYKASESGVYTFKYIDSAFTAYSGCWSTEIVGYFGPVPLWWDNNILDSRNDLFTIGTAVCSYSKESAINRVKGQLATAKLNKDDVITLVAGDSHHSDNIGSIALEIYFLSK